MWFDWSLVSTYLPSALENFPQLLRLLIAWVLDIEISPLADNLLSREWSPRGSPSGIAPPLLQLCNLSLEALLFGIQFLRRHDAQNLACFFLSQVIQMYAF
jgi:hypothetical protein